MRVLVDTNVILSAILYPGGAAAVAECDCLMTGDNDLLVLTSTKLRVVSPAGFVKLTDGPT